MKFDNYKKISSATCIILTLHSSLSSSYEVETHIAIMRDVVARSVLGDESTLKRIGLFHDLRGTWLVRPNSDPYDSDFARDSVVRADLMLEIAARREDDGIRAVQHFFDPLNDRGQTAKNSLTGASTTVGLRSYQWAISDSMDWTDVPSVPGLPILTPDENYFSINRAKEYLDLAVKETNRPTRLRQYSNFLAAIGHVVHHVQDMAQPEHVRNDSHCNIPLCVPGELLADEDVYDPSSYEIYVKEDGYQSFNSYDYETVRFNSYKDYWSNAGLSGMADFTNRFAVSKDTNFRDGLHGIANHPEFPYPDGAEATTTDVITSVTLMDGIEVSFKQTEVRASYIDHYLESFPQNNHVTATHSLFSFDIAAAELLGFDVSLFSIAGFSTGSKTFRSAASHLLPRAEAYSAGLIDYLLRGRIGVDLPEKGYYALSDHAPGSGFSELTFRLRNETLDVEPHGQDPVPQDIGYGELTAVVSYRPNPCYEDDLSGELHVDEPNLIPSGCSWDTWEDTSEVRVVSTPVQVSGISRDWTEVSFDFTQNPVPFSARDIEVYFLFRGELGNEADAVIVERHNISEPTYFATINSSDFVWTSSGWEDGAGVLENGDPLDDIVAIQYHDMSYDFDSSLPRAAGPGRLDAGHFNRIVGLFDVSGAYTITVDKTPERHWPSVGTYTFSPLRNETREVRDEATVWFGSDMSTLVRYRNKWCDNEGCTISGLRRVRGSSQWSALRQFYVDGIDFPLPTFEQFQALPGIPDAAKQPVTINE